MDGMVGGMGGVGDVIGVGGSISGCLVGVSVSMGWQLHGWHGRRGWRHWWQCRCWCWWQRGWRRGGGMGDAGYRWNPALVGAGEKIRLTVATPWRQIDARIDA